MNLLLAVVSYGAGFVLLAIIGIVGETLFLPFQPLVKRARWLHLPVEFALSVFSTPWCPKTQPGHKPCDEAEFYFRRIAT